MADDCSYEIGDLVSVVDNWWDLGDFTQNDFNRVRSPSLPFFDEDKDKSIFGIIVDVEVYPGGSQFIKEYKSHGLYHVLLSTGMIKKYFQNRLDMINPKEERDIND